MVRYAMRVDQPTSPFHGQSVSVNYSNGVPDFAAYSVADVDIASPVGRGAGINPRTDLAAVTRRLREEIEA